MSRRSIALIFILLTIGKQSVFASTTLDNTLSYRLGGEQNFRDVDHSTYFSNGIELTNLITNNDLLYIEVNNRFSYKSGFYYLSNEYTVPGKYATFSKQYNGRAVIGAKIHRNNLNTYFGIGGGYRYLNYISNYQKADITEAILVYKEFFIPIEVNFIYDTNVGYQILFNNVVPIGLNGLAEHIFRGPGGFTQPSYHNSIGIDSSLLLKYKKVAFGPYGTFSYLTLGQYQGQPTVPPGNQLKIMEFGLRASLVFDSGSKASAK
jgi:hypothetical protein